MEVINTHTGRIFVDREKQLEFLTVGDYGKENNLKADGSVAIPEPLRMYMGGKDKLSK